VRLSVPREEGKPVYEFVIREQMIRSQIAGEQVPAHEPPDDGGTRLSGAIRVFNDRYARDPIGRDQPPLTEDEVVAAIRWWDWRRDELPVAEGEYRAFRKIAETRTLPKDAELEVLTLFQPDEQREFDAWSVRIRMPREQEGWTYAFTIRERWIRCRSFEEMDIAWGEAAPNGLQAGVVFVPHKGSYGAGELVGVRFFFRNTGTQFLELTCPKQITRGYYRTIRVVDAEGKPVLIEQDDSPAGPVGWMKLTLAPGARMNVDGRLIAIGEISHGAWVETAIKAKPLRCVSVATHPRPRLRCTSTEAKPRRATRSTPLLPAFVCSQPCSSSTLFSQGRLGSRSGIASRAGPSTHGT